MIAATSGFDLSIFGLVCLSGLLGAIMGAEREYSDKPAGVRTHVFVAAGSTLLVLLAYEIVETYIERFDPAGLRTDPIRVIQAIVIGISFLGAGTIIHSRDSRIEGLTTAASIFLTAGIGIAVGVGRLWLAAETTALGFILLISARLFAGKAAETP